MELNRLILGFIILIVLAYLVGYVVGNELAQRACGVSL